MVDTILTGVILEHRPTLQHKNKRRLKGKKSITYLDTKRCHSAKRSKKKEANVCRVESDLQRMTSSPVAQRWWTTVTLKNIRLSRVESTVRVRTYACTFASTSRSVISPSFCMGTSNVRRAITQRTRTNRLRRLVFIDASTNQSTGRLSPRILSRTASSTKRWY